MRSFITKTAIATALLLAVGLATGTNQAMAGGYCHSRSSATVYRYVTKAFVHYSTRYDQYGNSYRVRNVTWKKVRVPVSQHDYSFE